MNNKSARIERNYELAIDAFMERLELANGDVATHIWYPGHELIFTAVELVKTSGLNEEPSKELIGKGIIEMVSGYDSDMSVINGALGVLNRFARTPHPVTGEITDLENGEVMEIRFTDFYEIESLTGTSERSVDISRTPLPKVLSIWRAGSSYMFKLLTFGGNPLDPNSKTVSLLEINPLTEEFISYGEYLANSPFPQAFMEAEGAEDLERLLEEADFMSLSHLQIDVDGSDRSLPLLCAINALGEVRISPQQRFIHFLLAALRIEQLRREGSK